MKEGINKSYPASKIRFFFIITNFLYNSSFFNKKFLSSLNDELVSVCADPYALSFSNSPLLCVEIDPGLPCLIKLQYNQ